MKRFLLATLVLVLTGGTAFADPLYPVTSFTDWTGQTVRDMQDPELGRFTFDEGTYGIVRRDAQRVPEHLASDSPDRVVQDLLDNTFHDRPDVAYSSWGDAGNPAYSPDWNHDGVYGDHNEGSTKTDFDADTDEIDDVAAWRYPCIGADGGVTHLAAGKTCADADTGGPYRLGTAREVKIVNARGLVLHATVWTPDVLPDGPMPGIVFSDGISSIQQHYFWIAELLASQGFVVLTYDEAGQGESEGNGGAVFGFGLADRGSCQFAGACMDLRDVMHWFLGQPIAPVVDNEPRVAPRENPADNVPNPLLAHLDPSRIGIMGHSMGAISSLDYLNHTDVPAVRAVVSLSGATATTSSVPIQFQTSDYDGSPTLVGPGLGGVALGFGGEGIGYGQIKPRYDAVRAMSAVPDSLIVLEGGTHLDDVDQPQVPKTVWANAIAGHFASAWMRCWLQDDAGACATAVTPVEHLSRAFASEISPASTQPSHCITVPTEASLNQSPQDFVSAETGTPVYDCTP